MSKLVTGGCGYIGAHCVVELQTAGFDVVIVDNLSHSTRATLTQIATITGRAPVFYEADCRDMQTMQQIITEHAIDEIYHFAALKAVSESISQPVTYYQTNLGSLLSLLSASKASSVKQFIFSSSATVYGADTVMPVTEDAPIAPINPYGQTKAMSETILNDFQAANPDIAVANLRYFNPVGAHESGLIGEDPLQTPTNLMPILTSVATGARPQLTVFGNDYDTPDGSGVRDFIHVMDLVEGHLAASQYLRERGGRLTVNLGTGKGISVVDLINRFQSVTGQNINWVYGARRPGDIGTCYADTTYAQTVLGWQAKRTIEEMCADTWRFVQRHKTKTESHAV